MLGRKRVWRVTKEPFARHVCLVDSDLEEVRDGGSVLVQLVVVTWCNHDRKGGPDRIATSDERSSTGRTARLTVPSSKANTLRRYLIEAWCGCATRLAAAICAEVAPAHIVAHDNDDVWPLARRLRLCITSISKKSCDANGRCNPARTFQCSD